MMKNLRKGSFNRYFNDWSKYTINKENTCTKSQQITSAQDVFIYFKNRLYLSEHIANILSDWTSCLETKRDTGNTNQN